MTTNDLATFGLFGMLSVWVVLIWWNDWLLKSAVVLIVTLNFCAGYAQTLLPVRFLMMGCAILALLHIIGKHRRHLPKRDLQFAISVPMICLLVFGIGQILAEANELDRLFRYTMLYPMMLVVGYLITKSGHSNLVARITVYISLIMGVIALVERLRGVFFVAGSYANAERLVRDGTIRSIVFAEHPLVLSVLLVAAVPLVQITFESRWVRLVAFGVLAGGVMSTNSRGALTLLIIWFAVSAAFSMRLLSRAAGIFLKGIAFTAAVGGVIALLAGNGSESLASTSSVDASAEYRTSLYVFAARSLIDQPFGWGLSGLPEGLYIATSYFGQLDIAKTVDSELALVVFDFGWLGILGFVYLIFALSKSERLNTPTAQSALLVTASGFYLALHSWAGLGSAWFFLIGVAFGAYSHTIRGAQTPNLVRFEASTPDLLI